jgi:pimeloyl-ACP methyl ester carboxylesterase
MPPAEAPVSEFFVGTTPLQMFVQHWRTRPDVMPQPSPLIMIHGGVHTGTSWVTTPDGRPGWAPLFAEHGYNVYVVDWPGVGRGAGRRASRPPKRSV